MATMKKTIGSPKPKEPKYKEAGTYNTAGKEIGASRRGIKQYDRTADSEKKVPTKNQYGGNTNSRMGDSKYPGAIAEKMKTVKQGDLKNLTATERGERQTLARYKAEFEREKIGRVREYYNQPKQANARGNRGNQSFTTKTTKDADLPEGSYTSLSTLNDATYGANKRFSNKAGQPKTRKNLLGRTVTKTKTAEFGAVVKGKGTKAKQIGDKVITKKKTVSDNTGIPFLFGNKGKKYGSKGKSVSRVGTSTNKAMKESGDTRGAVSGRRLGVTNTREDVKSKMLKSRRRVK